MKKNDYNAHYEAFIKELEQNPDQTIQKYCLDHGIVWRRLYDWMRRRQISLKDIYQICREGHSASASKNRIGRGSVKFKELVPKQEKDAGKGRMSAQDIAGRVRIDLPSGISISLEECSVGALSRLIVGMSGKEVTDVLA